MAPPAPDSAPLEAPRPAPGRAPLTLPIGHLKPGKMQPRTTFDDMDTLVESVKAFGLLQPILVRPIAGEADAYEIVAGERRWRAAQKAQLHDVPVVVRGLDDRDALQLGLIENLQRADLTPIDEAAGLSSPDGRFRPDPGRGRDHRRQEPSAHRQHGAPARAAGAGAGHGARGQLSAGQARALVGVPDPLAMAQRAVAEQLTVRELEHMGGALKPKSEGAARQQKAEPSKSADTRALEKRIEEALGLKADLKLRGLGEQSLLTLEIRDFDQLDTVVERLTRR